MMLFLLPKLFGDDGLMTKPEKSQLVRELEEQLKPDEYSYHHKAASALLIDVMAAVRRVPLSWLSNFSDLLSKFTEINDFYHHYGRCGYIFGIYNDNPSVKDTERLRRCSKPVVLNSEAPNTDSQRHDNILTISQNKVLLEIIICVFLAWKVFGRREEPMHVLDCLRTGHKTCVVISNDTDVIVALLFYMPTFLQEGLQEL